MPRLPYRSSTNSAQMKPLRVTPPRSLSCRRLLPDKDTGIGDEPTEIVKCDLGGIGQNVFGNVGPYPIRAMSRPVAVRINATSSELLAISYARDSTDMATCWSSSLSIFRLAPHHGSRRDRAGGTGVLRFEIVLVH
ncbi:hypothetical protein SAMN05216228_1007178 [Rhizobium tibeticum]|uniref:Uncharacterized protein n=1 Tax=Rhizobium tibeticum TaxID=501024 RepID=A0ABY1AJU5_9HYPH|nr:hypothetical protein SAMN05216228_1007178 [Rhizobium tibeticum]